jgi:hypothetical protein
MKWMEALAVSFAPHRKAPDGNRTRDMWHVDAQDAHGTPVLGASAEQVDSPEGSQDASPLVYFGRHDTGFVVAQFLIDAVAFASELGLFYVLGKLASSSDVPPLSDAFLLVALVALRWFAVGVSNAIQIKFEMRVARRLAGLVVRRSWMPGEKSRNAVLASRSIPYVLDGLSFVHQPLFTVAAAVGCLAFLFYNYGFTAIPAFATLALFIPLSIFLTRKSNEAFKRVLDSSESRLALTSKWLEVWRSARNWKESGRLDEIIGLARIEAGQRNADSLWRGMETYVSTFGRVVPFLAFAVFQLLWNGSVSAATPIVLITIPMLRFVLGFSRAFASYAALGRILAETRGALRQPKGTSEQAPESIVAQEHWEVFSGTLLENIGGHTEDSDWILASLNLHQELSRFFQNRVACLANGSQDVSQGQRTRLLLARALNLSLAHGVPLVVDLSFTSLDSLNARKVRALLAAASARTPISLSPRSESELATQEDVHRFPESIAEEGSLERKHGLSSSLGLPHERQPDKPAERGVIPHANKSPLASKSAAALLLRWTLPWMPAFCLAAAGLAAIGVEWSNDVATQGLTVGLVSVLAIAWVVSIGFALERGMRNHANACLDKFLRGADHSQREDSFQRASRDYQTTVERIAWYMHDIGWISSLLAVAGVGLLVSSPVWGLCSLILFGMALGGVWKLFIDLVVQTRRRTVVGFNAFLSALESAFYISLCGVREGSSLFRVKANRVESGFTELVRTRGQALSAKSAMANFASLSIAFLYLGALVLLYQGSVPRAWIAGLVVALASLDGELLRFFLALSGLEGQRVSLERLEVSPAPATEQEQSSAVLAIGPSIRVRASGDALPGMSVREMVFPLSSVVQITGRSGVGKSRYLMWISASSVGHSLYFGRGAPTELEWLCPEMGMSADNADAFGRYVSRKIEQGARFIVLDEALTSFSEASALDLLEGLADKVSQRGSTVVVVDHRLVLPVRIPLEPTATV